MVIASLLKMVLEPKAREFEKSTKDPMLAQKKVLLKYTHRNKDTEYGIKYNFAGIRSIEDFRRNVPIVNCADMRPYIERMKTGEKKLITSDDPIFYGVTSGTTNVPKHIPVTKYFRDKKAEQMDLWLYYILRDHPNVINGKVLAIVSPDNEGYTESGLLYGAESGHAYKNLRSLVKWMYSIPYEVFDIKDYAARYYCILRISMGDNISTISTLNPSTLVLLCQRIDEWKYKVIEDIEKGTISKDFDIPDEIRRSLERRLKPDKRRANQLRRILRKKKELLPKDFWPKLTLIECWKGGTVKLYLKELPQFFGKIAVRDFGCLSTEARSSITMSDMGAGGVLAISTNFYEFIPKEEKGKPGMRILTCDQIEKGKEYFIVVTTAGGLYRYDIDDIIVVDGFFNKTPVIEFVQKGSGAVSLTGEKMYESQVNAAILKAVRKTRVLLKFFSATVEATSPGRYVFLVEFDGTYDRAKKVELLRAIEEALHVENREYNDLRNEGVLGEPALKVVKDGSFDKYRQMKIEAGAHDGQFKAPELTGDMDFQNNFEFEDIINYRD